MGFSSDEHRLEQWEKQMNVLWLAFLLSFGQWLWQSGFVLQNLQTEPIQACYITDKRVLVVTFTWIRHLPIHPTHCLPFYHIPGPHRKPICHDVTSRISYFLDTLTLCVDLMPNGTNLEYIKKKKKKMCIRKLDSGINLQSMGLIH